MGLQASCQGTARIHLADAEILLLAQIKNQGEKEEPGGHSGAKAPAQDVQTLQKLNLWELKTSITLLLFLLLWKMFLSDLISE